MTPCRRRRARASDLPIAVKLRIEQNRKIEGKKTVLVAHSMGSSVALYFMKWCVLLRRHAVSGC